MSIQQLSIILLLLLLGAEARFPRSTYVEQDMHDMDNFREKVLESEKWWFIVFGGKILFINRFM